MLSLLKVGLQSIDARFGISRRASISAGLLPQSLEEAKCETCADVISGDMGDVLDNS